MAYTVGISTGMWNVGRDPGLLGLAQKIVGWGGTTGVRMVQIDVDTTAEFYEPDVEKLIQRVTKKYNMEVGVHGEIGQLMSLDAAERSIWNQSHLRLVETIYFADKFNAIYVNVHLSANKLLTSKEYESQRLQGSLFPVVSFDGQPLKTITEDSRLAKEVAMKRVSHYVRGSPAVAKVQRRYLNEIEKNIDRDELLKKQIEDAKNDPRIPESEKKAYINQIRRRRIRELLEEKIEGNQQQYSYDVWVESDPERETLPFLTEDGEYGAYQIVAAYMKDIGDPLWKNIAENKDPESLIFQDENAFHAAVAAKFLEGHLTRKDHPANIKFLAGKSITEFLRGKKLKMLFEVPEGPAGGEGLYRLFNPLDGYQLIKKLNSPNVRLCIDFEHMLSHRLKVDEVIEKAPSDFGAMIHLFHLGKPVAYGGTAHIPIARGSRAQEILYKWIYKIKKKGFREGYIIFERGSGRGGRGATHMEVLEDSVQAVRLIAEFLEKDTDPKNLPLEFYGISEKNKEVWAREMALMRDHAYDPLSGLLTIPEETHTFFSRSAIEKGKQKEWDRAKFR